MSAVRSRPPAPYESKGLQQCDPSFCAYFCITTVSPFVSPASKPGISAAARVWLPAVTWAQVRSAAVELRDPVERRRCVCKNRFAISRWTVEHMPGGPQNRAPRQEDISPVGARLAMRGGQAISGWPFRPSFSRACRSSGGKRGNRRWSRGFPVCAGKILPRRYCSYFP